MSATKELLLDCVDIIGEYHETFDDNEGREHAFQMGMLAAMQFVQVLHEDDDHLYTELLGLFNQYIQLKSDGYFS